MGHSLKHRDGKEVKEKRKEMFIWKNIYVNGNYYNRSEVGALGCAIDLKGLHCHMRSWRHQAHIAARTNGWAPCFYGSCVCDNVQGNHYYQDYTDVPSLHCCRRYCVKLTPPHTLAAQ